MSQDYVQGLPDQAHKMYCVKCREHVVVTGPETITMKNNKMALRGKCPHCTTMTFKITSKKN